jgi:xanthine dehydrogenase accessory factor
MKNIYLKVLDEFSKNASLVLATVTRSSGSTPRKPGSSALFGKKGLVSGTIGGGVVEGRVQKLASETLKSKKSCHRSFDLAYDITKKEEAICGGEISVLIDANLQNSIQIFEQLKQSISSGIPGVLVTMVTRHTEECVLVNRYWITKESLPVLPGEFHLKIKPIADIMILKGDPYDYREIELSIPGEEPSSLFFLEPVFASPKLIIAGAGHIGKALAHLGAMLDFEVTVIDDRSEYANNTNIPEADHIIVSDIGEALKNMKKGNDTFVVIVTRGHKDDAAALRPCIGTELAYLGMIGSRTKVAHMRSEFLGNGWATDEQWDKIDAPVGLEINSQTVEEIAISIAAQIILVRNSK